MVLNRLILTTVFSCQNDDILLDFCAFMFKSVLLQKYPMAVVGTAGRGLIIYQLENQPQEFRKLESPLKFQVWIKYILVSNIK